MKKLIIIFSFSLFLSISFSPNIYAQTNNDWYMAGANPQRTSWVTNDISGLAGTNAGIVWYRPIEAFIDAKTQIITANGKIYIATTKGLVVLDAETGGLKWRFDTEMPLGHSPTVVGNMVYIGGYDRKVYGIRDNGTSYTLLWQFTGGKAGYSTSPLVVNNRVYIGCRDGYFYALDATNGNLVWQFPLANQEPLGPIMDSAAYSSSRNTLYFASTNMRGYAVNASTGQPTAWFHTENGQQVAGTEKLPGMSIQSFWPVIFQETVIFSSHVVFTDGNPGFDSLPGSNNVKMENYRDVVFGRIAPPPTVPTPTPSPTAVPPVNRYSGDRITATDTSLGWPAGTRLIDTQSNVNNPSADYEAPPINLQQYFAERPTWRTTIAVSAETGAILNGANNPPFIWSGTSSGSRHPPIIDPTNNILYLTNGISKLGSGIARAAIMGWQPGNRYLSYRKEYAIDEPAILSGAGSDIMINLCCDRIAEFITRNRFFWSYGSGNLLDQVLPSQNSDGVYTPDIANRYDPMWGLASNNLERLTGYYKGTYNTPNGVYTNHGLQNPLVPYRFVNSQGQIIQRLFTHKSNTIVAIGETSPKQYLNPITIDETVDASAAPIPKTELISRLERHLDIMLKSREEDLQHRFLNPGYYIQASRQRDYYQAPAETLEILSETYQLLQSQNVNLALRQRLQTYIQDYYNQYLSSANIGDVGWQGLSREDIAYPPELVASMVNQSPSPSGFAMRDVYSLWKYAEIFPSSPPSTLALSIYNRVKTTISTTIPESPYTTISDWLRSTPWNVNNYIAGYYGLLHLQDMAGYTDTFCNQNTGNSECRKRTDVKTALNALLNGRSQYFFKDQPIYGEWDNPTGIQLTTNLKTLNLSRNFLYLTPELANHLASTIQGTIREALTEYTYLGPFWFASKVDNAKQERAMQHLFDSPYLFAAKAWILREPQEQLSKYIDVPAFPRGDLYYIKNLVTAISLEPSGPTPTPYQRCQPLGNLDCVGTVSVIDLSALIAKIGTTDPLADLDNSGIVNILDLSILLSNFGK